MTELTEDEVLAALRSAIEAQIVVGEPDGFRFRHALTRDVVLAELLAPELARLASRAADALEAADPDLPDACCELAADLREHAGQADRAADLLHISARRAMAVVRSLPPRPPCARRSTWPATSDGSR